MIEYVTRRVAYALLTLIGITLATFLLIHAAPGDPLTFFGGPDVRIKTVPPAVLEELRRVHHLDKPVLVQYAYWLRASARLDFGRSFIDRRPVSSRVAEKLPKTLTLNVTAFLLAVCAGVPLGVITAAKRRGLLDRISTPLLLLLYSLPSYWVALLLMQFFSVEMRWLPLYGIVSDAYAQMSGTGKLADRVAHLILPVITLAYGQFAILARFSRSAVLEVIDSDYVIAARAKGLPERSVILGHVFRNALIPLITILGMMIPYLLSGSVIVETIFAWDGLGRLYYDSVLARDYPTVMGLTTFGAVVTLLAYLLTDLLYSLVDPRIRVGSTVR